MKIKNNKQKNKINKPRNRKINEQTPKRKLILDPRKYIKSIIWKENYNSWNEKSPKKVIRS